MNMESNNIDSKAFNAVLNFGRNNPIQDLDKEIIEKAMNNMIRPEKVDEDVVK